MTSYRVVFTSSDPDSLQHYGVKGQRWGQRRYQNEDGSLTAEGRDRYGIGKMTDTKRYLGGDNMRRAFAGWRSKRHDKNLQKAKEKGDQKKIEKYESKKKAQDQANADMEKYLKNSSSAKLVAQNVVAKYTGTTGAMHRYRQAKARGASTSRALVELAVPVVGGVLRWKGNKEKYGKRIIHGADFVNTIGAVYVSDVLSGDTKKNT